MATNGYNLRSQADAADTFATLPGMGEGEPVVRNLVELKASVKDNTPCYHPRRLFDHISQQPVKKLTSAEWQTSPAFEPHRHKNFDSDPDCNLAHIPHELVFNGNQSRHSEDKNIISALCLHCHYHFVFTMFWEPGTKQQCCSEDQAKWPLPENAFPWHHLANTPVVGHDHTPEKASKYYPLIGRVGYVCIAPSCTFQMTIEISEPRLDRAEMGLLMDEERILADLNRATEHDPTRYEAATADWAKQGPRNMNTYLKNMLDDSVRPRSISKRNKRFAVIFGPHCFDLFRRLEFEETVLMREDGVDEGTFTPKDLTSSEDDDDMNMQEDGSGGERETEIGTYRAFIEDVRAEVQSAIHRMGPSDEAPSYIGRVLQKGMGCSPITLKDRVIVHLERYKVLGIMPEESIEVVANAYYREWSRPLRPKRPLIEALRQVANDLGNDRLSEYAQTQSSLFESQAEAEGNTTREDEGTPLTRTGDPSLPVGLENIGNTCYLNSLLQYLYTVNGVREIVNNFDNYKIQLDDKDDEGIKKRRIGGNKMNMDRGQVVVGQAFVKELAALFQALSTSDKEATQPTQRLANAVLLDTNSVIDEAKADADKQKETQPPPLPERTSISDDQPVDATPVDVSMTDDPPPLVEHLESSSTTSASTLIDEAEQPRQYTDLKLDPVLGDTANPSSNEDSQRLPTEVKLVNAGSGDNADAPLVGSASAKIDDKVLKALETQKRSSGTEQQDVGEVIGRIVDLLQYAIVPEREDETTGIQYEKMMDMLYITSVNYTKNIKLSNPTYQTEITYDRYITAFPDSGGETDLYNSLAQNFDQQVLEGTDLLRYSAIRTLPPILHVLIQRTTSSGDKNDSSVNIPTELYLDRYMDINQDSPDFQKRKRGWAIASRIRDLKKFDQVRDALDLDSEPGKILENLGRNNVNAATRDTEGDVAMTEGEDLIDVGDGDAESIEGGDLIDLGNDDTEDEWAFDGPVEDEFLMVNKKEVDSTTSNPGGGFSFEGYHEADEKVAKELASEEAVRLREQLNEIYDSSKEYAYRLEAVICHRGRLNSGHYWVWIYDFEDEVWRKYNDSSVTVFEDEKEVMQQLCSTGDPYYLCYVRMEDKEKWVSVPKRQAEQADATESGN